MGWSKKYKKSIDCDNPKGFSQRAHCQGRKKRMNEDLRNWFDPNHPEGGWKRYNTKGEAIGPCAREPGEPKPKCLSNKKAKQLRSQGGVKKIASAVKRKRREDPVANRRGKGGKPKMVSNKINEQSEMIRYCPKCQKDETKSECKYGPSFWSLYSIPSALTTNQMKFDVAQVHPANESKEPDHEHSMIRSELSTIQNAVKRLKKKMKGEGNVEAWVQSKITKAADYIDTAADYVDSGEMNKEEFEYLEEKNKPTNPSLWSRAKSLAKKKFDVYPSAYANGWAAKWYKSKGGGWKSVSESNFNISSEYSNWREELKLFEDWQKVNRQDKTDGLSQKAVDAYRRENPGSKLQTAVTEKKPTGKRAKRRASFCRRMKGMKDKLTSAETSRDPDSRINKALRRWNCN